MSEIENISAFKIGKTFKSCCINAAKGKECDCVEDKRPNVKIVNVDNKNKTITLVEIKSENSL